MGLFDKLTRRKGQRVFFLGLDGTPHSFIERMVKAGELPTFARLLEEGAFRRMNSALPCVSSVAWTSFMTGRNPAKHNIFGFIDRRPGTYKSFIPNAKDVQGTCLWDHVAAAGKKSVILGIPVTYPPFAVDGVMISGFLAPGIDKAVHPPAMMPRFKEMGYILDADVRIAHESLDRFYPHLLDVFEKRAAAVRYLLETSQWDLFVAHFMETDRLHHFMWEHMETQHPTYAPLFLDFYRRVDTYIAELLGRLPADVTFMMMSDHGFCTLKREVYVNHWLKEQRYLVYRDGAAETFENMDGRRTRAFSMDPGRIYLNVRGREGEGTVEMGKEYADLREELRGRLLELADPETGERMVRAVYRREEVFHGPHFDRAPDLVMDPVWGYDVKGYHGRPALTGKGPIVGMHTFEDAMFYVRGAALAPGEISVVDPLPTILSALKVPLPDDLDGRSLLT